MALQCYGKNGKDVKLAVVYKAQGNSDQPVTDGIREIYSKGVLADVTLISGEDKDKFSAHKLVLAAKSEVLLEMFSQDKADEQLSKCEIRLYETCPGAVKAFLDFVYLDEYSPKTDEINKDVLKLASQFKMPELTERCAEQLAKDVNTNNVVDRLGLCEEFQLERLREKIMQQLTSNRKVLNDVAQSKSILQYPLLMQEMLSLIAQESSGPPAKKAKRG
eukprot:gnl/MRDRNA2_/MRDRNA2_73867_c0_seq1.p1 gnl/MRDRNA2_/MRDRNA2_73867_c0~~gnl/MRDRNA2_/MRDRNA2_73867_c0_seq1.p1  ORF type:complete len:251 (+),score=66.26 gnl/MRDRNA2_/MRDRNA2_73867_c0_seq1:97-753(+)